MVSQDRLPESCKYSKCMENAPYCDQQGFPTNLKSSSSTECWIPEELNKLMDLTESTNSCSSHVFSTIKKMLEYMYIQGYIHVDCNNVWFYQ